jgi:hypothetical protein
VVHPISRRHVEHLTNQQHVVVRAALGTNSSPPVQIIPDRLFLSGII